jgi:hypothetical protein
MSDQRERADDRRTLSPASYPQAFGISVIMLPELQEANAILTPDWQPVKAFPSMRPHVLIILFS